MNKYDYQNEIPAGYYDKIFHLKAGLQSAWHHHKFNYVYEIIDGTVLHLDIGCGPGTFIGNYLINTKSIGIDLSFEQIKYANLKYKSSMNEFANTAGTIPYPDNNFETISLIEVIEHLTMDEINELLKECYRVLKPNGRIILTTPNYSSLWPALELLVNYFGKLSYADQHITKFNSKRLKDLIEKSNFKLLTIKQFLFISPFIAPISWRLSGIIHRVEKKFSLGFLGFLISAVAQK